MAAKYRIGYLQMEDKKPEPMFGEIFKRYLNFLEGTELSEGTLINYKITYHNHIKPVFGKKRIADITRADVADFLIESKKRGYSASNINTLVIINGAFNRAI